MDAVFSARCVKCGIVGYVRITNYFLEGRKPDQFEAFSALRSETDQQPGYNVPAVVKDWGDDLSGPGCTKGGTHMFLNGDIALVPENEGNNNNVEGNIGPAHRESL